MTDILIVPRRRCRAALAATFAAGCVTGALSIPRIDASVHVPLPRPVRGEVLSIAAYLCNPNGGTVSVTQHVDPQRYSFVCRNEAVFSNVKITIGESQ